MTSFNAFKAIHDFKLSRPSADALKDMSTHPHFLWTDFFSRKNTDKATIIDALSQNILFQTLNRKELRYISNYVYERSYQADEPIFAQADRGLGMYLIVKGKVAIRTQSPQPGHSGDVLVTVLRDGSFFGELALVDPDHIRTAHSIAMEKTSLIGFFKPDLTEILERKPDVGVKILFQLSVVLGRRLLETTEKITLLTKARGVTQLHEDIV